MLFTESCYLFKPSNECWYGRCCKMTTCSFVSKHFLQSHSCFKRNLLQNYNSFFSKEKFPNVQIGKLKRFLYLYKDKLLMKTVFDEFFTCEIMNRWILSRWFFRSIGSNNILLTASSFYEIFKILSEQKEFFRTLDIHDKALFWTTCSTKLQLWLHKRTSDLSLQAGHFVHDSLSVSIYVHRVLHEWNQSQSHLLL